jgi:hypothetical protein
MASFTNPFAPPKDQTWHPPLLPPTIPTPPASVSNGGGLNSPPVARASSGPTPQQVAAANAAAADSKAKAAGKAQSAKENSATQGIIDALMKSLEGYAQGRDTGLANNQRAYDDTLTGILSNYASAVADYDKTSTTNEQDEVSKSAANVTNRARERMGNLMQVLSQGGGETDALRSLLTVFQNFDANQMDIARSFFDTDRQIGSQITGANTQAETSRRSAWQQLQEANSQVTNDYYKNYMDVWTNAQRTAAQNTNTDSDYSTAFNANFGGKDPVQEASKFAGKSYETETKDDEFFKNFQGRKEPKKTELSSTSRAGTTTINAPQAAEGATLRGRG